MHKRIIVKFFAAFVLTGMVNVLGSPADLKDAGTPAYAVKKLQPTPESMAQRETDWMTTELNLSADQVEKVSEINVKYAQKQMEMFQGGRPQGGGDMSAIQGQMAEIAAEKRTELQPILSAEQLKAYDEYLANNPGRGRGGPGGGFGGPPPDQQ